MSARISAPARMRVDAIFAHGFTTAPLAIVHVGQSAVVLRAPAGSETATTLLIFTPEASGLMPGGACLDTADFRRVRNDILYRQPSGRAIELDGWDTRSTKISPVGLALQEAPVSRGLTYSHQQALRRLSPVGARSSVMSPEPIRRNAPAFAQQVLSGRLDTDDLRSMIGAGPGTTPSGDDVIVGVLAGLRVLGLDEPSAVLSRGVNSLISTTTEASRHYLNAATENRFGEHVHELVDALSSRSSSNRDSSTGDSAKRTLRRAARWGAASGIDLLVGLVSTLITSLDHQSSESAA